MDEAAIEIRRLAHHHGLPLPAYATAQCSGMDLHAAIADPLRIAPGGRVLVPTGLCVAIPQGMEGQIRPRSGLAASHGVTVLNAPGTIDADYRGEIKVLLVNLGEEPFEIRRGDRIAQIVVQRVVRGSWRDVTRLGETERDCGGFGHTGR
jgi:dUTP pyrophosphatase